MKLPKFELNITPMTRRRLRAFRNNRRAWWSLMAFCVLAVFAMCAELVCPCDPKAITKPETLEAYRRVRIEEKLDVRAARFNLTDDGKVESYEGPADVLAAVTGGWKTGDPIEQKPLTRAEVKQRRRSKLGIKIEETVKKTVSPEKSEEKTAEAPAGEAPESVSDDADGSAQP